MILILNKAIQDQPSKLGSGAPRLYYGRCLQCYVLLMKKPEEDIEDKAPIWDLMQDLYMDTDVTLSYGLISEVCAKSKYSLDELERILFNEVLPALTFNMFDLPAPEWAGFQTEWVVERI